MFIFQLFVSKINSNSLFRTHVVRLYDLMSYNYTLPSRTTIGCHVVRHENLLTLLFNLKNHNSLIFSTFFSSFIFSIFTHKIRISWKYRNLSKENIKRKSQTLMAASTLFVQAVPPKEGFVSASFNSHCVAFLSLHINVLFIKV